MNPRSVSGVVVLGLVLGACAASAPAATDRASESTTPTRSPATTRSPWATPASAVPAGLPPSDSIHFGETIEFEAGPGRNAGVIEGFDGQALMDDWENQGFSSACTGPKSTTGTLLAWTCGDLVPPLNSDEVRITFIGESPSAVHLIVASVTLSDAVPIDARHPGGFLAYVAETAEFTGADTAAARAWTLEYALQGGRLEISGVTYTLSGTAERRVLEIGPSVSSN